jgi:hypothetical protein
MTLAPSTIAAAGESGRATRIPTPAGLAGGGYTHLAFGLWLHDVDRIALSALVAVAGTVIWLNTRRRLRDQLPDRP